MLGSLFRIFSGRRVGVFGALALTSWPIWGRTAEQARFDFKLIEKFEAEYHNHEGMGLHFSPEARYSLSHPGTT